MSPAPDTLAVILAPQPVLLQHPPESFWQSNFVAGVVGALVGSILTLLSPFVTNWVTDRVTSQRVARRMRRNLQEMRTAVTSVESLLDPARGMLDQFGAQMLNGLAEDLDKQLRMWHKRANNTVYLKDEAVEDRLLATIKALTPFAESLRVWAAPVPSDRDDIRITDYSHGVAASMRSRSAVEVQRLDAAISSLVPIEGWRWRLP